MDKYNFTWKSWPLLTLIGLFTTFFLWLILQIGNSFDYLILFFFLPGFIFGFTLFLITKQIKIRLRILLVFTLTSMISNFLSLFIGFRLIVNLLIVQENLLLNLLSFFLIGLIGGTLISLIPNLLHRKFRITKWHYLTALTAGLLTLPLFAELYYYNSTVVLVIWFPIIGILTLTNIKNYA
jgi:hypothetical protein